MFSSPFIEERLYFLKGANLKGANLRFSSPFIEERLYLIYVKSQEEEEEGSRPLLSRSGCIFTRVKNIVDNTDVLVPFYRGAVVFVILILLCLFGAVCSRPLLSRSGCICY